MSAFLDLDGLPDLCLGESRISLLEFFGPEPRER